MRRTCCAGTTAAKGGTSGTEEVPGKRGGALKPIPDQIRRYIADAPVCRIATVRPGGEPHVIPVCPAFDGDATVYIDLGRNSTTAAALRDNRRIAVLIDDYHDDWSKLRKVILRCTAEEVRGAEQEAAWARIREKFPQYTTVDWRPRLTLALRVYDWLQEGFAAR